MNGPKHRGNKQQKKCSSTDIYPTPQSEIYKDEREKKAELKKQNMWIKTLFFPHKQHASAWLVKRRDRKDTAKLNSI